MKKIGFLGCGNIAKAIAGGAVKAGCIAGKDLVCFDIDKKKVEPFLGLGATLADSSATLAGQVDILFLTVKPQVLPAVLEELTPHLPKDVLLVSPVAGVRIAKLEAMLSEGYRIIRVMPNTPLCSGAGATALSRNAIVTDAEFSFVTKLFAACGVTAALPEEQLDAVTGISGSSPAFFMRFAKAIIAAGVADGMKEEDAKRLVLQTMAGTAKMVMESDQSIDDLICAVASPGGTTEAGLKTMDALQFDQTTSAVLTAAIHRSKELAK